MQTRLLESGVSLFFNGGVRFFTMEGVAESAGVSKRTLYKYFPSRHQLIEAVIKTLFQKIRNLFIAALDQEKNPVLQMNFIFSNIFQMISSMPMDRLLELKTHYPDIWERVEQFREERLEDWKMIFFDGQKKGYFKKDLNMEVYSKIHVRILNSVFNPDFLSGNDLKPTEVFPEFLNIINGGILTEKGKKYESIL